jgi:hypothetical protein
MHFDFLLLRVLFFRALLGVCMLFTPERVDGRSYSNHQGVCCSCSAIRQILG